MPSYGPIAPRLAKPARIPRDDIYVVPSVVNRTYAEVVVRRALREGLFGLKILRPKDIDQADVAPMVLAWFPLWRVDVSGTGFYIGMEHSPDDGRLRPTGGIYGHRRILVILGRRLLAIDPSDKVKLRLEEMVPRARKAPTGGEVVQPDVSRLEAEQDARERFRHVVQPMNAVLSQLDARVRSAALAYYPLWIARYRYTGDAKRDAAPEECHVAVSARTGKIVSSRHPSSLRSVAQRLRGLFR
jgi:hypothetical protein